MEASLEIAGGDKLGVTGTGKYARLGDADLRSGNGRAVYFVWTAVFILISGSMVLSATDPNDNNEFEKERTTYISVYGVPIKNHTARWQYGIIGVIAICASGVVAVIAAMYVNRKACAMFWRSCNSKSDNKVNEDMAEAWTVVISAVLDIHMVLFLGIATGTAEWSVLTGLIVTLILTHILFYRISVHTDLDYNASIRVPLGLVSLVPWTVILINAQYFWDNVKDDFSKDDNRFDDKEQYRLLYAAVVTYTVAMYVRNGMAFYLPGLLTLAQPYKGTRAQTKPLDLTAYTSGMAVTQYLSAFAWIGSLIGVVLVVNLSKTKDDYPDNSIWTYRVSGPEFPNIDCNWWPAGWLLFAGVAAQALFYGAISVSSSFSSAIVRYSVADVTMEMVWFLGPGLFNGILFIVLASSAGSSDWQEFLVGGMITWLSGPAVWYLTSGSQRFSKLYKAERVGVGLVVIVLSMVPYAFTLAKAYLSENTEIENHEAGGILRILLISSVSFYALVYFTALFTSTDSTDAFAANYRRNIIGVSFYQLSVLWVIILGKVLRPASKIQDVCKLLEGI